MTDAKVIAPFAVLHACAMALGVGMLVVLLRGTQEPRPDDRTARRRWWAAEGPAIDSRTLRRWTAAPRRATGVRCAPARGTGDEHYATAQLQGCWLAGPS